MSSSCARAVPIWKKKFNDVIHSKRLNINIDELLKADLSGGKMCRSRVSAFERLDKLEKYLQVHRMLYLLMLL